jgi:hypothetical protein
VDREVIRPIGQTRFPQGVERFAVTGDARPLAHGPEIPPAVVLHAGGDHRLAVLFGWRSLRKIGWLMLWKINIGTENVAFSQHIGSIGLFVIFARNCVSHHVAKGYVFVQG